MMKYTHTHTYISIITLNVNDLNALIERHKVAKWIRKEDPQCKLLSRDPPQNEKYTPTKSKGFRKYISSRKTKNPI